MTRKLTSFLIMVLLASLVINPVKAAQISIDQVNLHDTYPYSNHPVEINQDAIGNFIASDDAGVIWKINPVSGSYTLYDTAILGLSDATSADAGYYFTDFLDGIAFTDLLNTFRWIVPLEDQGQTNHSFGPIELDSVGGVWAIEYDFSDSKIYKINRNGTNASVCTLIRSTGGPDYGTYAYDLDYYGGFLWWYNWFDESITRLNLSPVNGVYSLESWRISSSNASIEGRGNEFDSSGNFWISGGPEGTLFSFNPVSEELTTYTVPGDPSIEGVAILGSQVWYADLFGSAGILFPAIAPKVTTDLSLAYHLDSLVFSNPCNIISGIVTENFASTSGTLPFTPRAVTENNSNLGWTIFPLSIDEVLSGIGAAQGVVLMSETNVAGSSGQLIRFIPPPPIEFKVFLPLIKR